MQEAIVITELSGLCPVQAEGMINGQPFYFRARHNTVSLGIGGDNLVWQPAWEWVEDYGEQGDESAGYLPHDEARHYIAQWAQKYLDGEPSNAEPYYLARRIATVRMYRDKYPDIFASLPPEMKALVAEV